MADESTAAAGGAARDVFPRKVLDVRKIFRESLNRHLAGGRIVDKEKLEQDKLKISASLVNFVVSGGILKFKEEAHPEGGENKPSGQNIDLSSAQREAPQASDEHALDESSLFILLRKTILMTLKDLNKPDVNLIKISLSQSFRQSLKSIFTGEIAEDPEHFPVKIFHEVHHQNHSYLSINMRNTRSLGDDLDRIERDPALKREIVELRRPSRHTDGNLYKMFTPLPGSKETV